jgi:phosphonate transport system permease protein
MSQPSLARAEQMGARPVGGGTAHPPPRARRRLRHAGTAAAAMLVVASWWFVLAGDEGEVDLLGAVGEFAGQLAGAGLSATPAYLEAASWADALGLAVETLAMSVLAAGLAGAGVLATVAFGARNLTYGEFSPAHPAVGRGVFLTTRAAYIASRAIPDFIWALLIVFVLKAGVLAGALALAVHNFGVLGRLSVEIVEDTDMDPLRALRSSGAGNIQVLFYGVLPQLLPQFMTFLLYRWEVIIRTAAIVGFVAAVGLGYELQLDLSFRRFTDVGLLMLVYILLVWAVDLVSAGLRRLAR